MKKHIVLQNAMILVTVALLILSFIPGTMTGTYQASNGDMVTQERALFTVLLNDQFFGAPLFLMVLVVCIGAFSFRVTQATKPLDWTLMGSLFGVALYLLFLLLQKDGYSLHISVGYFVLFLIELILTIIYKIGRQMSIFV